MRRIAFSQTVENGCDDVPGLAWVFPANAVSHSRSIALKMLWIEDSRMRTELSKTMQELRQEFEDNRIQFILTELDDQTHRQIYIPPGFAHGFCVLSSSADFFYKCTDYYAPSAERGIIWNDPALAIPWPVATPILSAKDCLYTSLAEMESQLPRYLPG